MSGGRLGSSGQSNHPDWFIVTEWRFRKHILTPGTLLSIEGIRGRAEFRRYVFTGEHEWVDVFLPNRGLRSFDPQRIRTVHRRKIAD